MKVDFFKSRTFAFLLSVIVSLTTAAPPVWTHCHQDCSGYQDSDHQACSCADRQAIDAENDTCCGDHAAKCSVDAKRRDAKHRCRGAQLHCGAIGCSDNVSHYHVAWLGMTARVPVDKKPKQPKRLYDEIQSIALLPGASVPLKEIGSSWGNERPVGLIPSNATDHALLLLRDRPDPPPDALLCDVARRERTGVLVI